MARKVLTIDDITGEEGAAAVDFALRGVEYRIDLTEEGEQELVDLLTPYIEAGERVGGKAKPARAKPDPDAHLDHGSHSKEEVAAVKAFMAKHNIYWSGMASGAGRVPVDIWSAWRNNDLGRLRPGRLPEPSAPEAEAETSAPTEGEVVAPAKPSAPPKRSRARRATNTEQTELVGATA